MVYKILNKLKILYYNLYTIIYTFFRKRDPNIIVIGSWMGKKFSDNSRYLYQYLFENIETLNIKKVIWITTNDELNKQLNNMGYESYLYNSKESKYWHLKAGIHVVCNYTYETEKLKADIDTKYSWGAKKVQLWHGIGMKSVGNVANSNIKKQKNFLHMIYSKSFLAKLCFPGGWNKCYYLCTSELDVDIHKKVFSCDDRQVFISDYPRNCQCIKYTNNELKVIDIIKKFKFVIIYLPTFRTNYDKYIHPLNNKKIIDYIKDNNILWIEKPHTASNFDYHNLVNKYDNSNNILLLDSDFDINVLYQYVNIVLSDYSSAVLDGIYKGISTIMYVPDLKEFKNGDIGLLYDVEEYFKDIIAFDLEETLNIIKLAYKNEFFTNKVTNMYDEISSKFFKNKKSEYNRIWSDIKKLK